MNQRFSVTPSRAVKDSNLSDSEYRTLAALGLYGDENGWCYPSQTTIAKIRDISRGLVSRHVTKLARLGYLNVYRQNDDNGAQKVNKMQIKFDYPPPVTPEVTPPVTPEVTPPVTPEVTQTTQLTTHNNDQDKTEIFVQGIIDTWNSSFQEFSAILADGRTTIRTADKVITRLENGEMRAAEVKARKRLAELYKDGEFRETWREALRRVVEETPGLAIQSWFKLSWFIGKGKPGNDPGYVRCMDREFAWHNSQVAQNLPSFNQPVDHVPGNPDF